MGFMGNSCEFKVDAAHMWWLNARIACDLHLKDLMRENFNPLPAPPPKPKVEVKAPEPKKRKPKKRPRRKIPIGGYVDPTIIMEKIGTSMAAIAKEVCQKHGITKLEFMSKRRRPVFNMARQEFMYRARNETLYSFPQIARFLGGRDHTTVMHGVRAHEKRLRQASFIERFKVKDAE